MNVVSQFVRRLSGKARARRAALFRRCFALDERSRILDLGSEDGSYIHSVLVGTGVQPENVFIADIDARLVAKGAARYGFQPVAIDESGRLPFEDGFFDLVHCSSVIEHVTVSKAQVWSVRSGAEFARIADERQAFFAREIERLGRQYFVQTPNRLFPIESHSWLPFAGYLPRPLLIPALRLSNGFWVKRTAPDWRLLTARDMARLFAGAEILHERFMGLSKSVIAVRSAARQSQTAARPAPADPQRLPDTARPSTSR